MLRAMRVLGYSADLHASRWMKVGNGKMGYGRTCVRSEESSSNSEGPGVVTPGACLAHAWLLRRRNGRARGICNRYVADCRVSRKQILAEAQWRLNSLICGSGPSACRVVSGSNTGELFGWGDKDGDLLVASDASLSG